MPADRLTLTDSYQVRLAYDADGRARYAPESGRRDRSVTGIWRLHHGQVDG